VQLAKDGRSRLRALTDLDLHLQANPATATTTSSNAPSVGALAAVFVQASGLITAMFQLFQDLLTNAVP
jgi:hypothetical protein